LRPETLSSFRSAALRALAGRRRDMPAAMIWLTIRKCASGWA